MMASPVPLLAPILEQMFGYGKPAPNSTYARSVKATSLPVDPTDRARSLAINLLSAADDPKGRESMGQELINALNESSGLPHCDLKVADRRQVHEHDGQRLQSKTYGFYRCWFDDRKVSRGRIRIYNRTAVRQQVVSPKVFLNTLLHEWMHHYDFAGLRLSRSPHTSGFYARLHVIADRLGVGMVLPSEMPGDPQASNAPIAS